MRNYLILLGILTFSCNGKPLDPIISTQAAYFEAIEANDIKLSVPRPGDWLYDRKEKGQSFETYKKTKPVRATTEKSTIYLQPIGKFTALQMKALSLTREYVSIFFQQNTILLPTISDQNFSNHVFRKRQSLQLLAPYILDTVLKDKMPKDGIALMAITEKDLYPGNDWNFVFGLASYSKRVGVSSIYRLHYEPLTENDFNLCLERLINISSHEIGHMFTISHCTFAHCVMNGSNGLAETDISPNRLCSECQKKLFWNLRYNNQKKATRTNRFLCKNQINERL